MAIAVIDSYKTSIYPSGRVIKELTDIETGKEIAKNRMCRIVRAS